MHSIWQEFRHAWRVIWARPLLTLIALISLALGTVAATTTFSLLSAMLLTPLPYPDPDRLVVMWQNNRLVSGGSIGVSVANYYDWQEQTTSFSALAALATEPRTLTGVERPARVRTGKMTPDFFNVLGVDPILGRAIVASDGHAGAPKVVAITESFWHRNLGARENVLGTTLELDQETFSIVSVVRSSFEFVLSGPVDLWIPYDFSARRDVRGEQTLAVIGRLSPTITLERAQSEMTALSKRLEQLYPDTNTGSGVLVRKFGDEWPDKTDRILDFVLVAVALLCLLVASISVAIMFMAKNEARQGELAIRAALGAGRGRLLRELLVESLVLALLASVLGLVIASASIQLLADSMPSYIPSVAHPRLDLVVISFHFLVSILAGLTCGLGPIVHALRGRATSPVVDGRRGASGGRKRRRLHNFFVIAELAVTFVVLVAVISILGFLRHWAEADPGFETKGLLTVGLSLSETSYPNADSIDSFVESVHRNLVGIPGVRSVAFSSLLPRADLNLGQPAIEFTLEGEDVDSRSSRLAAVRTVSADYFAALDVEVPRGRPFSTIDAPSAPAVAIINERFAAEHFQDGNEIGRRLMIAGTPRTVIGVSADIAENRLDGLMRPGAVVYLPMRQHPVRSLHVLLEVSGVPLAIADPVRTAIRDVDPHIAISALDSMDEYLASQLAMPRFMIGLLGLTGALVLGLAAMGLYGVMSFSVVQRTSEIGIRMALGAPRGRVLAEILRSGFLLEGIGLFFGVPGALWAAELVGLALDSVGGELVDSSQSTLLILPLVGATSVLLLVGLMASYLPARRASRIDPAVALTEN